MKDNYEYVLNMAQLMIDRAKGESAISREMIVDHLEQIFKMDPSLRTAVDVAELTRELEMRFSIWIGKETFLVGDDDHQAWLNAERKQNWRYWRRYREYLDKKIGIDSADGIDRFTDSVLKLLEDPRREGAWDRRGLVVGHVQSGKTSNYTGLVCKAADAGYKLIVVLAGLHDNLRSQTQMRLDEGFLGYKSALQREMEFEPIGVGLINSDPALRPNTITNHTQKGDFNRTVANNFSINPGGVPLLFVVKKNSSVLKNLLDWVRWAANSRDPETRRAIVRDVPLLVIDDEADHASVDTKKQEFDDEGIPDPDHDPTRINACIRQLLFAFEKSAYVGYTATPFANIFIHDNGRTTEEGEDLFPRSFIVNLAAPSNYAGPTRIFGLDSDADPDNLSNPLPLVRYVEDHADTLDLSERSGWVPPKHTQDHVPLYNSQDEIPRSLRRAIFSFILAGTIRRARGQTNAHNSMLIHVTRLTNVQNHVYRQIDKEVQELERALRLGGPAAEAILDELRILWETDFVPTSETVKKEIDDDVFLDILWEDIQPRISNMVSDIEVKAINGSAGDVLDYITHQKTGLNVIAVGGEKLSRGLTLEGLTVSYFLRTSRMYDTLMQMGRWFGYRPGYLDLCRLYMTEDLDEWFQHITEASEELRMEFDHMAAVGGTPKQYGLKVRTHQALMITSRVKMRNGTELDLSFDGSISETIVFHTDTNTRQRNLDAVETLLQDLGVPDETNPVRERPDNKTQIWRRTYMWTGVPAAEIKAFLESMTTHPSAVKVNKRLLADYIGEMEAQGELTSWHVALVSGGTAGSGKIAGLDVDLIKRERSPRSNESDTGKYVIRRLLSPRDEAIDLDKEGYRLALEETQREWHFDPARSRRKTEPMEPSGPSIRGQRNRSNGLLLLYPIACVDGGIPFMGMGVSFPRSPRARRVRYRVNNVYAAQEWGD